MSCFFLRLRLSMLAKGLDENAKINNAEAKYTCSMRHPQTATTCVACVQTAQKLLASEWHVKPTRSQLPSGSQIRKGGATTTKYVLNQSTAPWDSLDVTPNFSHWQRYKDFMDRIDNYNAAQRTTDNDGQ